MSFSFPTCETWYCIAYLQIGGVFEATAPFGIILAGVLLGTALVRR